MSLRRLAANIVAMLPDNSNDALVVLRYARELVEWEQLDKKPAAHVLSLVPSPPIH
jgi:hypothetical protein